MANAKVVKSGGGEAMSHRLTLRMTETDYEKLAYWANKKGMSINEFVPVLLDQYVSIQNGDYDLPVLEIRRLNQLCEHMDVLSQNVAALENTVHSGLKSLVTMTSGDNYLLDN